MNNSSSIRCKKPKEDGFTLIELMIVVTIIGILAAVVIPRYITYMLSSQAAKVGNIGGLMVSAMQAYADAQSLSPLATVMLFKGTGLASPTSAPPDNPLTNVLQQLALPGNASFSYQVSAFVASVGPQSGEAVYCITATPTNGAAILYSSSPVNPSGVAGSNGRTGRVFNKSYVSGLTTLSGVAGGYCSATGSAQPVYS